MQPESGVVAGANSDPADWHALLLRMAGVVPDDLLSSARAWLAEGRTSDVAATLAAAAEAGRIPVQARDRTLIRDELSRAGKDTEAVQNLELIEDHMIRPSWWMFSPVRADLMADGGQAPIVLNLTGWSPGSSSGSSPAWLPGAEQDRIDQAAVTAVSGESGAAGLWRAWRLTAHGLPWPPVRRVFVVAVAAGNTGAELIATTGRLQHALAVAGEPDPQVEVCPEGLPWPAYQGTACARGALLWVREVPVEPRLARVFDAVDAERGPRFDPDHPLIDDPAERQQLLQILDAGLPVLTTTATMADVVDPGHPQVVPLSFRTDGVWVWTDSIGYYLKNYSLAPESDLLEHFRTAADAVSAVSEVALHRVLSLLQQPDEAEPVLLVSQLGGIGNSSLEV